MYLYDDPNTCRTCGTNLRCYGMLEKAEDGTEYVKCLRCGTKTEREEVTG